MFKKLLAIQRAKNETTENDYFVKPEGHLVWVTCGHRGQPNRAEEKRISRLLRKSGFIPMLEEISQMKKDRERQFEAVIEAEDKKQHEESALEKAQNSRANSRKLIKPNIKVVSQQQQQEVKKKSPLLDIVIDLEETVNPLTKSSR